MTVGYTEGTYVRGFPHPVARFVYFDGLEWREPKGSVRKTGVVTAAALGPDGSVHFAYGGSWLRHLRLALPDLKADWESLSTELDGSQLRVTGSLMVQNLGASASRSARVSFFLSDDDALDETDQPVGKTARIGRIGAGNEMRAAVSLVLPGVSVGKRLLAVIDPQERCEDIDRPNNTAALILSE